MDVSGKVALWQVIARVIAHGARLSAVRLAQTHAVCAVLPLPRGFDEHDLDDNLPWLAANQGTMERRLCTARRGACKPPLLLYDVTRS